MTTRTKLFILAGAVLCVLAFFLIRGSLSSPEVSEDEFVQVYVELSIASEMFSADSVKLVEERTRIFRETGVTQDELDDFVSRLSQKPAQWAGVWEKVVEQLEERRQELK
jgi:hypothetical protein